MQTLMSNRHWDTGVWITQEGSGVDIQIQQGASGSQDHKTEKGRLACRMRREAAVGRTLWGSEGRGVNATLKAWVLFSVFHSTVRASRAGTGSVCIVCVPLLCTGPGSG